MSTRIRPPAASPHDGFSNGNGHIEPPFQINAELLSLLGAHVAQRIPRPEPFGAKDYALLTKLRQEIDNLREERDEILDDRVRLPKLLESLEEFLPLTRFQRIGLVACAVATAGSSVFAWLNASVFVRMNYADAFWQALVITAVVPGLPFVMKYFLAKLTGGSRRVVDALLFALFMAAFILFADQLAEHFVKKDGITITPYDPEGTGSVPPLQGPVSMKLFYFATLILESLVSFVAYAGFVDLRTPKVNPLWVEARSRLAEVEVRLRQFAEDIAQREALAAELDYRKDAQEQLLGSLSRFFR